MSSRLDLNRCPNNDCSKKCTKEIRRVVAENDLCSLTVSKIDRLAVRCVGEWAEQKIYLLSQYFGIFATGMKNKWSEINYIEICSGPGRCIRREVGEELDGTALTILKHKSFPILKNALFFDYDTTVVNVLNQRISKMNIMTAYAYVADYNQPDTICSVLRQRCSHDKSLNLILLDPTDCSVPFELLRQIKHTLKNVDILINVATGTDFSRNIPQAFADSKRASKYNKFVGNNEFFIDKNNQALCRQQRYGELRNAFREAYQRSLMSIGYSHFCTAKVEQYYTLLFAASNPKAAEFWRKATKTEYDGQRQLLF